MVGLPNLFGGSVDVNAGISNEPASSPATGLFGQDTKDATGDGTAEFDAAKIISGDDPLSGAIRGILAAKGLKASREAKDRKAVLEAVNQAVEQQAKQVEAKKKAMEMRKMQIEQDQKQALPILYSNLPVLMSGGETSADSRKQAVLDTFSALYKSDIAQGNLMPMGVTIDAENPDMATISYKTSDGQVHNESMNVKQTLLGLYPDDAIVQQWVGAGKESKLEKVGVMGDDGKVSAQYAMRRPDGTFVGADGQTPIDAKRIVPMEAFTASDSATKLGSPEAQRAGFNKFLQAVSTGDLRGMSDDELVAAKQQIVTVPGLLDSSQAVPWQQTIDGEINRRQRMTQGYAAPGATPAPQQGGQVAPAVINGSPVETATGDNIVRAAPNEGQGKAATFASRMANSNAIVEAFSDVNYAPNMLQRGIDTLPASVSSVLLGGDAEQFFQARRDFINATLRRESGAVISESEFANAEAQYFPVAGDSPETLKQKAANRAAAIEGFKREAGPVKDLVGVSKDYQAIADTIRSKKGKGKAKEAPAGEENMTPAQKKALDLLQ